MKNYYRYPILIGVLLVLSGLNCLALELKHFTLESGLPSRTVYDVDQDDEGYIWVASQAGLSRFNGVDFKNFTTKDGLPRNEVVSLSNDGNGKIWLNVSGTLTYIQDGKIFQIEESFQNDLNWNFSALANSEGDIWLSSKAKIKLLDRESLTFKNIDWLEKIRKPASRATFNILTNNGDTTYIRYHAHLYKILGNSIVDSVALPFKESDNINFRYSIVMDIPHIFYLSGTELIYQNMYTEESHTVLSNLEDVLMVDVLDEFLWISSRFTGLTKYTLNSEKKIESSEKLLKDKYISNYMQDRESNLWICSYDNGLYFKRNTENASIENISFSSLAQNYFELVQIINDTLWLGSRYGELLRVVDGKEKVIPISNKRKQKMNRIMDLQSLDGNKLLVSTDEGFFLLENDKARRLLKTTGKKISYRNNVLLLNTFQSSIKTTIEDLMQVNDSQEGLKYFELENVLLNSRTFSSFIDKNGDYWLANSSEGLLKMTKSDTVYFKNRNNIFLADIVDFTEDENGNIYVATVGDGIIRIDIEDNSYLNITSEYGLSSNVVYSLEVNENMLYVGTNKGVSIIAGIAQIDSATEYKISKIDISDGLASDEIKDITLSGEYIYATSSNGLIKIKRDFRNNEKPERVIIEEVAVESEVVPLSDSYTLKDGQDFITVKFNALSYTSPTTRNYKYRLLGQSDEWLRTTSNEAHFHNLKPGEYTFEIAAINSSASQNPQVTSLDVTVKGKFTDTALFKALLAIATILLINFIFNFINSIRRQRKLKSLVNQKTNELNQKLDELASLNRDLKRSNKELSEFAYICSHDLKTPLRNISSFSELLYRNYKSDFDNDEKEYFSFVKGGISKMDRVINDLLSLSKVSSDRIIEEVNFNRVLSSVRGELTYLIRKTRTKIVKDNSLPIIEFHGANAKQILSNLISNAIKYNTSANPRINVGSKEDSTSITLYVKDNGIGIEDEYKETIFGVFKRLHSDEDYEGTGIGLAICERIVTKFHGKIWVESEKGEGSTFYISLPKFQRQYSKTEKADFKEGSEELVSVS